MTTLSLGSATVLDLHHYVRPDAPSPPMIAVASEDGESGRAIAAVPLGHVLLERRSLFVLTGALYQSHLHGIAARTEDWVRAPQTEPPSEVNSTAEANGEGNAEQKDKKEGAAGETQPGAPVIIANADLLSPIPKTLVSSPEGLKYERETRVSLTFRHAKKVLKGGKFSMLGGALRRT